MSCPFCSPNLDAVVKDSAYLAGFAVAMNNPVLAKAALPVALATMQTIDGGGDNGAINALFQAKIGALLSETSSNPVISMAVGLVLTHIGFDPKLPTLLSNETLKELVDSFVMGMQAVK